MSLFKHHSQKNQNLASNQGTPYKKDVNPEKREKQLNKRHKHKNVISMPHLGVISLIRLLFTSHQINRKKLEANKSPLDRELYQKLKEYSLSLKWPANWLSYRDKKEYCIMGIRPQTVRSYSSVRLFASIALDILPIAGVIFLPKYSIFFWLSTLIFPFLVWWALGYTVRSTYSKYAVEQQLRFDYLMSVMSPYLYEMNDKDNVMNDGNAMSINYILGAVADRVHSPTLQNMVSAWNISVRRHPGSFLPYQEFAQKFLGSGLADNFVYAVYQLANGATDTSSIHFLNRNARNDYYRQCKEIIKKKSRRFGRLPIVYVFDWIALTFVYLLVLIFDTLKHAMSQAHE